MPRVNVMKGLSLSGAQPSYDSDKDRVRSKGHFRRAFSTVFKERRNHRRTAPIPLGGRYSTREVSELRSAFLTGTGSCPTARF